MSHAKFACCTATESLGPNSFILDKNIVICGHLNDGPTYQEWKFYCLVLAEPRVFKLYHWLEPFVPNS